MAGIGVGVALGGVALGATGKSRLEEVSQPGMLPEAREAPLRQINTGTALTWTGVAVAGAALIVGIALVVASDARARRVKVDKLALRF